jgi:transposase
MWCWRMSGPATISSAQVPDVDDVRRWMQQMIKSLRFGELVVAVVAFVVRMRDLNTELTKRLGDLRRGRPRSETLRRVHNQLALNFAAVITPVVYEDDEDEGDPSSASSGATSPSGGPPKEKKKRPAHRGRAALPEHLERVTESNDVPPDMRQCPLCGEQMKRVSHSMCEILDVRPAELIVRRRLDERVACRNDDTIVSAPKPPQLVERGKLGTTLIVESLADKYLEHQPIERQCLRWSRIGVDIAPDALFTTSFVDG